MRKPTLREVQGLPGDRSGYQVSSCTSRHQTPAVILWQVYFLLKVRWSSSKGSGIVPQCRKLALFKYFSSRIRTGPYVCDRVGPTGRGQMTSTTETRRTRNRRLAVLNTMIQIKSLEDTPPGMGRQPDKRRSDETGGRKIGSNVVGKPRDIAGK